MKKLFSAIAALFVACAVVCSNAHAASTATSYLLIQGPFGPASSTETYKWKITYDPATVVTGQDLLNVILGAPVPTGGTVLGYPYLTSINGTSGAGYLNFFGSLLVESLTIGGQKVAMTPDWSNTWHYNVAGGSGSYNADDLNPDGLYANGAWVYSNDSSMTRLLADGSFDAWAFGIGDIDNDYQYFVEGAFNLPLEVYFADAIEINAIPEPGTFAFVLIGFGGVWAVRRRKAVFCER